MNTQQLIDNLKFNWQDCHKTSLECAELVPKELWSTKPFDPRFKSFAWEFACLARTRLCYLKSMDTGRLNFSTQPDIPDRTVFVDSSKEEVIKHLNSAYKQLRSKIEQIEDADQVSFVAWLLQHERIHHGKLVLYLAQADLELPPTFAETWGRF